MAKTVTRNGTSHRLSNRARVRYVRGSGWQLAIVDLSRERMRDILEGFELHAQRSNAGKLIVCGTRDACVMAEQHEGLERGF